MYHDTLHIREVFFCTIFDLMCDEMSCTHTHLPIDYEMELDESVESTFSHATLVHMLYCWMILLYVCGDLSLHTRIDYFV